MPTTGVRVKKLKQMHREFTKMGDEKLPRFGKFRGRNTTVNSVNVGGENYREFREIGRRKTTENLVNFGGEILPRIRLTLNFNR